MKKTVSVLFVILLIIVSCCSCKEIKSGQVYFEPNEEIVICTPENISEEAEKLFLKSREELKTEMLESDMLITGARKDRTLNFSVVCQSTEFTQQIKDFSLYKQTELNDIAKNLSPEYVFFYESNGSIYIVTDGMVMGNEHPFSTRQYVTVKNGNMYIVSNTTHDEMFDETDEQNILKVIDSITVKENKDNSVLWIVILSVAILLLVTLIALVAVSIVRDLKKKEE
ncbi:MAG: hypothetical protein U0M42_02540 [Acutalibacteraceae bacterium]|nr:hypothetical protein [Acutalibacteraceae bacterium]